MNSDIHTRPDREFHINNMANEHDFDEESKLIDDDRESDEESNSLAGDDKRQISIIHTKTFKNIYTRHFLSFLMCIYK